MKYLPNDTITKIPLVGTQYSIKLERLGINTILDLLNHYPSRYEDTRDIISIQNLLTAGEGTILATIEDVKSFRTKRGRFITKATIQDDSDTLEAVWFNQPYLTKTLRTQEKYLLSGKITTKWGTTLSNPQFESAEKSKTVHLGKLTPIYPETYGVSSKWLRSRISYLKPSVREIINDNLAEDIIKDEKLMRLDEAILKIHFPD
ncbi:MAG: DNA helicase RecG, partial [Patescibacteria group bacterium]|nr:DNA helicase RecG [Patescibacteria group bacterium]